MVGFIVCIHGAEVVHSRLTTKAATVAGHPRVLEDLLEKGQDPNTSDGLGTPLWRAAYHGRLKSVNLLLQARADTEKSDSEEHRSPLLIATDPWQGR